MLQSWREVLDELKVATKDIAAIGPDVSLRLFSLCSGTIYLTRRGLPLSIVALVDHTKSTIRADQERGF